MSDEKKNRKYSLIDKNVFEWMNDCRKNNVKGLCVNKFRADFVIEGLKDNYKLGDQIELNGETCHISEMGKRCFANECELFRENNNPCPLKDGVAFVS